MTNFNHLFLFNQPIQNIIKMQIFLQLASIFKWEKNKVLLISTPKDW